MHAQQCVCASASCRPGAVAVRPCFSTTRQQHRAAMDPGAAPAADMDAAAAIAAMDPFPDMSEEEVVALLQSYEKSGMALGPVPEDLRVGSVPARHAQ